MTLEEHLSELGSVEREAFSGIVAGLRALPVHAPSDGFFARVMDAVKEEDGKGRRATYGGGIFRRPSPAVWRGIGVAALLALCFCLAALFGRRGAQPAVNDDALAWIRSVQESDGSWLPSRHGGDNAYRPALTALAALTLEEAGGANSSVDSACRALTAMQAADGTFGGRDRVQAYNTAVSTYALAVLAPAHNGVRDALARAVRALADTQSPTGGWDYGGGKDGNSALTAWSIRALAEAERQGITEARVPLRRALRWMRDLTRETGAIAYHRGCTASESESLRALAAHALMTAGDRFTGLPELGKHLAAGLKTSAPQAVDGYRDYAKVLAFNAAGDHAKAEAVLADWRPDAVHDAWGSVGGRVYTETMRLLAPRCN
ncbi:MAG: hypothetical protein J5985_06050 [Kiritimatiellae bacterium]|nr:hypothetical protein [Kiritimatiellia bacterium]